MLQSVRINGFQYFVDVNNRILYADSERKSGVPFSFLIKNELELVERELRFPRREKNPEYSF